MKLVYYTAILNNHQANVADELWKLTNHQYCFVELADLSGDNKKGDTRNYAMCPYLLRAWESKENWQKAMNLARSAECCVFGGGNLSTPFLKERVRLNLLSFEASERWLKKGLYNILSRTLLNRWLSYKTGNWCAKSVYKLCNSAFAAGDHYRLGMYKEKCYKWGYFTKVEVCGCESIVEASTDVSTSEITPLMWCSRFLMLKHPELPILMAERLKKAGYKFQLDMYGEGEYRGKAETMVESLNLSDVVSFYNNKPNNEILADMRKHEIFLFTSDRNEGWGAVSNESMSNGCVLVASDAIGSTPYLVKEGVNGFGFKSPKTTSSFNNPDMVALDSLCEKVMWLLDHPEQRLEMRNSAVRIMRELWSPSVAAKNLLQLVSDLKTFGETTIKEGPCSKALPVKYKHK